MNETLKSIAERYSCRDFSDGPLTGEQVNYIVNAALAAPSAMNRQPWQLIAVTDKKIIEELDAEGMGFLAAAEDKSAYERMMSRGGKMLYNAPCMFIVASDTTGSAYAMMDCGILSQNIALSAQSLGLGSVICGMAGIPFKGKNGAEWKKRMQFPDGYEFGIAILVGRPESGGQPHESDMGKVTYIGA